MLNRAQKQYDVGWIGLTLFLLGMFFPVTCHATVTVTPTEIEQKVLAYLAESTPLQDPQASLISECIHLPGSPLLLKGDQLNFFLEDSRSVSIPSRIIVQVTISTDEETRHVGVPVRISVEKPVWVTTRLVKAKEGLNHKDVVLQRKRLDTDLPYVLSASDEISQYTSRVNLAPGSILDVRKITQTPAVFRNDDVRITLAMGEDVQVSVYGKAMEDGAIGQRIRVSQITPERHRKIYNAKVIGKNSVRVEM